MKLCRGSRALGRASAKGPLGFELVFGVLDIIGFERVFDIERLLRVWNGGEKFECGVIADAIRKL